MWAKASISSPSELAREAGEAQPVGEADRPPEPPDDVGDRIGVAVERWHTGMRRDHRLPDEIAAPSGWIAMRQIARLTGCHLTRYGHSG
jgi:hypothetical protein